MEIKMHCKMAFFLFQVSYLEAYVDGIVQKWKVVSDKLVDAAKMGNVALLRAQVSTLVVFS